LEPIRVPFFPDLSVSKSEACSGSLERFGFILIDSPRSESSHAIFRCEHVSEIDNSFQWIGLGASMLHWDPLSFVTASFFGLGQPSVAADQGTVTLPLASLKSLEGEVLKNDRGAGLH
jgi:hypothetical protein